MVLSLYFCKLGTVVPTSNLSLSTVFHPEFHYMLTSLPAHILPKLTVFTELTTVLPSFDTFTFTMGPTVFLVIRVPRV